MDAAEQIYAYLFASNVSSDGRRTRLEVATSGGDAPEIPLFYDGELVRPFHAAALLIAVAGVAASRFYTPPGMLARILLAADPVVVSDGERLRFEALSACCGVYARADFLADALGAQPVGRGTTNVDFNPPMRAALSTLRDGQNVRLTVGDDGLLLERNGMAVAERRVKVPPRWVRSFGEVQALQASMEPVLSTSGVEALRFLRSLPRSGTGRHPCFVVARGSGLRLAHAPTAGAIRIVGAERLRALELPARDARQLVVYAHASGASGWSLEFADSRLVFILSPEPSRGLSGEGTLLETALSDDAAADARVLAALRWNAKVVPGELARELEIDETAAAGALARLAADGLVGYDLTEGGYFYRALPVGRRDEAARLPRLVGARQLVDQGRVRIAGDNRAIVAGREGDYIVSISGGDATCTCTWFARHSRDRGACRHVLAVQMTLAG